MPPPPGHRPPPMTPSGHPKQHSQPKTQASPSSTIPWWKTGSEIDDLATTHRLTISGRRVLARSALNNLILEPSPLLPSPADFATVQAWREALPEELPTHCLVLIQAGASALGLWEGTELVRHKVIRKYVVRGQGRAQTLHLKTRGKSRYGSRLRLQNAKIQLEETNAKLRDWWDEEGAWELNFLSIPKRTQPEWFATEPSPPFEKDDPGIRRIPLDVHIPDFEELQSVHRRLLLGKLHYDENQIISNAAEASQ